MYDVHNALYTVAADHENQINKIKANPVLSVTLQNSLVLAANSSSVVYWNTSSPLARVGTWATTDGGTIKVPESGTYRFTMNYGGWSTGAGVTCKAHAWIATDPGASSGAFLYPPGGGDAATTSFTFAATLVAGHSFTAYVISWWQGFQSDAGLEDRKSWNLTVEKISG
ncbi:hypothetical protein OG401_14345 [Kitasatospora purpeofusca]|uniref:hypothetical protein n=1 Tax=Kitasatospora purpeofusca TaxID=67352 RepID=UPI00224CBF85|nr:hypothetical protein [Kitasatospora purpeofusca]MCX4685479.1 hypothetical protein [Kitasatospora purpeofusca]